MNAGASQVGVIRESGEFKSCFTNKKVTCHGEKHDNESREMDHVSFMVALMMQKQTHCSVCVPYEK